MRLVKFKGVGECVIYVNPAAVIALMPAYISGKGLDYTATDLWMNVQDGSEVLRICVPLVIEVVAKALQAVTETST